MAAPDPNSSSATTEMAMTYMLVALSTVFAILAALSTLLFGAAFSKTDRRKHPILYRLDGKKWYLFLAAFIFLILSILTNTAKDLLSEKNLLEVAQGPGGILTQKATATAFQKELQEAAVEKIEEASDYFYVAEHDFKGMRYRDAAKNYKKSVNVLPTMSAFLNLSLALWRVSNHAEAHNALTAGLQIAREKKNRKFEAIFLGNIGNIYIVQGKLEKALQLNRKSHDLFKQMGNRSEQAHGLNNIGVIYRRQGRLDEALKLYREALGLYKQVGNRLDEAKTKDNVGNIYRDQGRLDEALRLYREALGLYKQMGNRLGQAKTKNNVGNIYRDQGRLDEALKLHREAVDLYEQIGVPLGLATALNSLGMDYAQQKNFYEALDTLERSRSIFLQIGGDGEFLRIVDKNIEETIVNMKKAQ